MLFYHVKALPSIFDRNIKRKVFNISKQSTIKQSLQQFSPLQYPCFIFSQFQSYRRVKAKKTFSKYCFLLQLVSCFHSSGKTIYGQIFQKLDQHSSSEPKTKFSIKRKIFEFVENESVTINFLTMDCQSSQPCR